MTTTTATTTSAPAGKGRKALIWTLRLIGFFGLAWVGYLLTSYYHPQDHLPSDDPALHLKVETKKALGQKIIGDREDRLLQHVRRNPEKGVEEVANTIATYWENVGRLNGGVTGKAGAAEHSDSQHFVDPISFTVLESDPASGSYKYQLDGRVLEQETFDVSGGDLLTFSADATSRVCTILQEGGWPCTGPAGNGGMAKFDQVKSTEFPVGEAGYQELVGYVGSTSFHIGQNSQYRVPAGIGTCKLRLGANVRKNEAVYTTGGFEVEVKVTPKT